MKSNTSYHFGQIEFRSYVKILCFLSATILISIASMNYLVDPYLIHQWDSPLIQRLRPPKERLSPWGKTYAIAAYKPSVLYLGSSRTELGLPTGSHLFTGQKVFNGAISGASIADAIIMAKHASRVSQLDTVIWGIDYPSFSNTVGNTEFDRELIAGRGNYFLYRFILDVKRTFAIDMTRDSIAALLGSLDPICRSSLAFNGQRDSACMNKIIEMQGGIRQAIKTETRNFANATPSIGEALRPFSFSIKKLCTQQAKIRLYINPTHALTLSALYWNNKWDSMETWLHSLASIVDNARQSGCNVRLFDFSGFNSITTDAILWVNEADTMRYYWEASHYRDNVGAMILERMFNSSDSIPDDFGIELNSEMLPAHLRKMRLDRDQYHRQHLIETQLVQTLVTAQDRE
ncbi:hypothetical protein FBR06_04735 [Betaproteobacteria bacterium PRO4]|nr:hypothetical protein [Betaproteobacteria bacterium PRO4]